jgi:hypothetical protein
MEIILVREPYPRDRVSNLNINSSDPLEAATAIHNSMSELGEDVLDSTYKRFGGLETFTAKDLSSSMKFLRTALMRSKNFSPSDFEEIFDGTPKIARDDAYTYAAQPYFLTELSKFMRVWKASRTEALNFMRHYSLFNDPGYWDSTERLPMVHTEDCRGDEPGNMLAHFHCKRPWIYHSDRNLAFHVKKMEELEATMDPKVIDFIQENILDCSASQRELYAASLIVRSDHWETLAKDPKRSVLNALAGNALLPTHVAEAIVTSHKTPSLREDIAKNSVDRNLLNMIWSGTKSESIREVVESNALFSRI